jgi:thiamine kinase-like enzyme
MHTLERTLGPLTGSPEALDGGITNRNLQMCLGGALYVVRLCGKDTGRLGIDRESEVSATRAAHGLGIAPEVVLFLPERDCVVTRWVAGTPATLDQIREPRRLAEVARGLRAFHGSSPLPTRFDAFRLGQSYRDETLARGGAVPAGFDEAMALAGRIEVALQHSEHAPVPCHNDLLTANFILTPDGVRIVDWEYAGMGDRYFDLGNLAVNNELGEADGRRLLEAYWGEPPDDRRVAALALMRIVSDYREAAWGMVQCVLSELDFDYAEYARTHLSRLLDNASDPRLERWLDAASA